MYLWKIGVDANWNIYKQHEEVSFGRITAILNIDIFFVHKLKFLRDYYTVQKQDAKKFSSYEIVIKTRMNIFLWSLFFAV